MTTKHTKGPWRIGDNGLTVFGPVSEEPAPVCIASLPTESPRVSTEERKHNGLLISAAPEMLSLLKRINDAFYVTNSSKALREIMAETKPLIRKAEGREKT